MGLSIGTFIKMPIFSSSIFNQQIQIDFTAIFSLSTGQTFKLVFHPNVCRQLPLLSALSVQCQKAISAPWYTRHLLLFNWRPVSSCYSVAKRPYLFTCKSSIYFLSADVTASFWLALTQCWLNVVPSSMTLFQHWTNIVSGYWVAGVPCKNETLANAVLQMSHGRRRWASSKLALGERVSC